jgi:hypothetical protein
MGAPITLGAQVEDMATGFTGIAVSRVVFLSGGTQYGVLPRVAADGTMADALYIDDVRLRVVGPGIMLALADGGAACVRHHADGRRGGLCEGAPFR